jgi:hypothetical protein
MFIAALLTKAKLWNQPTCQSSNEWIKKVWWSISFKRVKNVVCRKRDETRDHHVRQNRSDSGRQISHFLLYEESRSPNPPNDMNVKWGVFGGDPAGTERAKGKRDWG